MSKILSFNKRQCVQINNKEEFDAIYNNFRSAERMSLETWAEKYGYPEFPVYLEKSDSVHNESIGFTREPINTWTQDEYEVITLEQATT